MLDDKRPRQGREVQAQRRLRGHAAGRTRSASRPAPAPTSSTRASTRAPSSSTTASSTSGRTPRRVDGQGEAHPRRPASRARASSRATCRTAAPSRFYGDNHPHYAGSVVRAMASAKDGYPYVVDALPRGRRRSTPRASRRATRSARPSSRSSTRSSSRAVHQVNRLTPNIVEIVVHAPMAARKFQPGQFYRLQNYESYAPVISAERDGGDPRQAQARLAMEGLALTGAWVDAEKGPARHHRARDGRQLAPLRGARARASRSSSWAPRASPPRSPRGDGAALRAEASATRCSSPSRAPSRLLGGKVLYFAGYRRGEDLFKREDIERWTDQVIWCTDGGAGIAPRRPQDRHFRGTSSRPCTPTRAASSAPPPSRSSRSRASSPSAATA